jgi:hypothetical protein
MPGEEIFRVTDDPLGRGMPITGLDLADERGAQLVTLRCRVKKSPLRPMGLLLQIG